MRTIKFRAWDKVHKQLGNIAAIEWNEDCSLGRALCVFQIECCGLDDVEERWESCSDLDVMESTGLLDSEGREIFEGDILGDIWGGYIGYCDKCKSFELFSPDRECLACSRDVDWWEVVTADDLEVAGNIYEHPHLLDVEPGRTET